MSIVRRPMSHPLTSLLLAPALAIATVPGCSFSKSSESISDSISSPFEWSKSSSGGDSESEPEVTPEPEPAKEAYSEDVTEISAAFGTSGGDIDALRSGITQLAQERGVTNWEADPLTCESIGRGMQQAGVDQQEFNSFASQLFGADEAKLSALEAGYRGAGQ